MWWKAKLDCRQVKDEGTFWRSKSSKDGRDWGMVLMGLVNQIYEVQRTISSRHKKLHRLLYKDGDWKNITFHLPQLFDLWCIYLCIGFGVGWYKGVLMILQRITIWKWISVSLSDGSPPSPGIHITHYSSGHSWVSTSLYSGLIPCQDNLQVSITVKV